MPDESERPVGFASRTLLSAKCNYSQLEKEILACIFGVKKFHIVDRLQAIFKQQMTVPAQASAGIQRWVLTLAMYKCNLQLRKSTAHGNTYALSRLPLPDVPEFLPDPPEIVLLMEHQDSSHISSSERLTVSHYCRRCQSCIAGLARLL